jgi:alpha-mannosidase
LKSNKSVKGTTVIMTLLDKYMLLTKKTAGNYYPTRVVTQIGYALKMSSVAQNKFDSQIETIADCIIEDIKANDIITATCAKEAEKRLSFLSVQAKKNKVICVAHAHIDMNWMWGYQETAATTLDTFRTMLDLMDEYKNFTFSQSQAAVYKIVEENDCDMLQEIKQRVKEGRWEITASTWVEADKNMPNGESLARHILYTKRYLKQLFDLSDDEMRLDFEPDTFGHSLNVPEILEKGGIKYYYHCRAHDDEYIYRYQSPSGADILVYRDPAWYNTSVEYTSCDFVPQFCDKYGVDVMLKVYGVGNHGGGPSRRDIERISDMMTWPVMPVLEFGTYHRFFQQLEKYKDNFNIVKKELNFVFNGCYTSQSRIKMANRISEDRLMEAEAISAAASLISGKSCADSFGKAWEKVLFNQFHDILPGSGVIDTREYAMANFQQTMAIAGTNVTKSLRTLAQAIDTSSIEVEVDPLADSEGGGVGFAVDQASDYRFPQSERGNGKVRIFHLFNPTMFDKEGPVEITVWDWYFDLGLMAVKDEYGNSCEWKLIQGLSDYWGHRYFKVVVDAKIPTYGYATYILTENERQAIPAFSHGENRCDNYSDSDVIMENGKVKATFDRRTMALVSFVDKESGMDVVSRENPAGVFQLITEDTTHATTAWKVGHYQCKETINEKYNVTAYDFNFGGIRQWFRYDIKFRSSSISVMVSLDKNSSTLNFSTTVDWHEIGNAADGIPQLGFYNPVRVNAVKYRYDIPFGTIDRDERDFDMPGNSFVVAIPVSKGSKTLMMMTNTKYGFRTVNNSLYVNMIRSSFDPDPYPEYGVHTDKIGLSIPDDLNNQTLKKVRDQFVHGISFCAGKKHAGTMALSGGLFKVGGDVIVSSVKTAEESCNAKSIIVRIYDANGIGGTASLDFGGINIKNAEVVDINETAIEILNYNENVVHVDVPKNQVVSLKIEL